MNVLPSCRLTAKDHAVLETILHRSRSARPVYDDVMQRKLDQCEVCLRDDIPADVVTLNSSVLYRVDGETRGPVLVVQVDASDLPPFAVSIHDLTGLVLLGMAEGERALVRSRGGRMISIGVEKVIAQPEAGRSERRLAFASG